MQSRIEKHENTELLIDLIQGALEEEGYETKRYSDGDRHHTTAYDAIMVKSFDGNYYTLDIAECVPVVHPYTNEVRRNPEDEFNRIQIRIRNKEQ